MAKTLHSDAERQIAEYREYLLELGRAPNTVKGYLSDLRSFATFIGKPLWPIPPDLAGDVKLWLADRRRKGISDNSMRRHLFAVKGYYAYAGDDHAFNSLVVPRAQFYLPKVLQAPDVDFLMAELQRADAEVYDFYRLVLLVGFRFHELFTLVVTPAQLAAMEVEVADERGSRRPVKLGTHATAILEAFLARGGRWQATASKLKRTLDGTAARCGLARVTCHILRSTCAARLLAAKHDPAFVKANLGWRTDQTLRQIKKAAKPALLESFPT